MPSWSRALEVAQCEKGLHYNYSKIPFECRIPGGLTDGRKIFFNGVSPPNSQRFAVNLQAGSDIAYHLNPRFDEGVVVANSRIADEWGSEQRTDKIPLRYLSPFLICITNTLNGYELEINNEWIAQFDHRIPFDQVTSISIDGDVELIGVHILNDDVAKGNLISIPGGVETNLAITVGGQCNSDFSGFYLNLQCGDSEDDDVAFHFNPRGGGTDLVIRNSYISGSWGEEEREGNFPFGPGEIFSLTITTLVDGFQIKVNGKPFTNYTHRLPISKICKLNVQGDVKIRDVSVDLPSAIKSPGHYIKEELVEPATPAKVAISDFKPGSALNVIGIVNGEPSRFKINLQSGEGEDDDVLLHLNPRWDQGEPKIVLNSREGGDWAEEEMWSGEFPFDASSRFEIDIQCEAEGYRINIDGFEQVFKHRIDYNKTSHVIVDGSIEIKRILVS